MVMGAKLRQPALQYDRCEQQDPASKPVAHVFAHYSQFALAAHRYNEQSVTEFDLSPKEDSQPRELANAWVARFAPLVMGDEALTDQDVRARLALVEELRRQAPGVKSAIGILEGVEYLEIVQTFRNAESQLDSIEADLRKRLARLAPGDPAGLVDLDALQERLSERAARQEMGLPTSTEIPSVLEAKTSPGNPAGAAFMGLFGLGWNSFTAFHATLMIGGMMKAFGLAALALLGFYSIFFAVGIGLLISAFKMAASEFLRLDGHGLTITQKFGPISRTKRYQLDPTSRAAIGEADFGGFRSSNTRSKTSPALLLVDTQGRQVTFAQTAATTVREQLRDKINAYLEAQP